MILNRLFHRNQLSARHVLFLFSFIFVIWALYRYFPNLLSDWVEEAVLKPIVWLVPTFWIVKFIEKENLASLGITKKNLKLALFWGLGLGIVFALEGFLTNIVKYRQLGEANFTATGPVFFNLFILSFVTAVSEEVVFRGYIFNRFLMLWRNEWKANIISSLLFVIVHLPIGIFTLGYSSSVMLVYLFLIFVYGFGAAFVFARTKNIVAPILLHVLWSWPIVLFN